MPLKSKSPKHVRKNSPSRPISGAPSTSAAIAAGGSSPISAAVRSDATILRVGEELVAVAVIAVGVSVDERVDARRRRRRAAHRRQHLPRQLEVEQRVNEQRALAVHDQARVAPAPAAVGLQVRIEAVSDLVHALGVAHASSRV